MSPLLQALIMTVEECSPRLSSIKVSKAASKERHLASRVRVSTVLVFFETKKEFKLMIFNRSIFVTLRDLHVCVLSMTETLEILT